jgi:hypothetical protein
LLKHTYNMCFLFMILLKWLQSQSDLTSQIETNPWSYVLTKRSQKWMDASWLKNNVSTILRWSVKTTNIWHQILMTYTVMSIILLQYDSSCQLYGDIMSPRKQTSGQ